MPHAKKTRRLREEPDGSGSHNGKRLRNLQRITLPQAQATTTKALGSLGHVVAPALQAERDMLFEKYLRAYDNYQRWKAKAVPVYTTNYSNQDYKTKTIDVILKRHVDELSEQLRTYDQRICAATTTGALLY